MAIDMEKMRAKLSKLRGEGNGGGNSVFWKPNEGNQDIRIVPTNDGDPLKEMWFHYNLGNNRGFLCPKRNFGDRCPVCDFASNLWRDGVEPIRSTAILQPRSGSWRRRQRSPCVGVW